MKQEENKNKVQSRREFFKNVAQKTLPMLGFVFIGGTSKNICAKDITPMSCKGCYNSCNSTCVHSESKRVGCPNNCWNSCYGECYQSCTATCELSCVGGCGNSCQGNCQGTCQGNCRGDCMGTCMTSCQGSCKDTCSGSCFKSCAGSSKLENNG